MYRKVVPLPLSIQPRSSRARALLAGCVSLAMLAQCSYARLYDDFNSSANWSLANNSGTAAIGSSVLTLTSPAGVLSTPQATSVANQGLSGTRQSILVRSHTGVANATVFFLWATDPVTGNKLELKLDDVNPTTVVAGYYTSGTYHFVGSTSYNPGSDGLYMAFRESSGTTYWEISKDASSWTDVASAADPVNTSSMTFEVQHKAYVATSSSTKTVVDCFNYKATGVGYHSLEDKTYSGSDGWELYTEGFSNNTMVCSSSGTIHCNMTVNGVDSTQHFTDTSIPSPYANQNGIDFEITSTGEATTAPRTYFNAYRYQNLAYVDANTWTYHMYFKYTYPQYITQGLEFPINKYTGSQRLQAAVAWYPVRDGTDKGQWSIWNGSTWVGTGQYQNLQANWWYEVTFTAGLHDGKVYYSGFQAGNVGGLTTFTWNNSYSGPGDSHSPNIVPAMQLDDNIQDTTTANTRKDAFLAEWNIDWQDEKLP